MRRRLVTAAAAAMLVVGAVVPAAATPITATSHTAERTHDDRDALVAAVDRLLYSDVLPAGCPAPWAVPTGVGFDRQFEWRTSFGGWGATVATAVTTVTWTVTIVDGGGRSGGTEELRWRQDAPGARWILTTDLCAPDVPPPAPSRGRFGDDDGSPHEAAIERLVALGVIAGYPDGTFKPGRSITGRQAQALVGRAIRSAEPGPYGDVPAATRGQIASLIAAALATTDRPVVPEGRSPFSDVGEDTPHRWAIIPLASAGILGGYADGTYRPDAPVTRGQMATILSRVLDRLDQ